jgi:hypothetical protein
MIPAVGTGTLAASATRPLSPTLCFSLARRLWLEVADPIPAAGAPPATARAHRGGGGLNGSYGHLEGG